jgi:DNA adenine methylase Dam
MKNKLRLLRYSGSKINYIDKINNLIKSSNKKIYYEPFIGSGAIFLNLEKQFDEYYINDLDINIIFIFNTIKNIAYTDFLDIYNNFIKIFGDIGENKESYYNFRNYFNDNLYKNNSIEKGIALLMLYNSCINSFARFGPNGFNQGYGNRNYTKNYTRETHNSIKEKLNRAIISNKNFFDIEFKENSILFLDPPYIERPSSYENISNTEFNFLIKKLKTSTNDIIYTDILHNKLD